MKKTLMLLLAGAGLAGLAEPAHAAPSALVEQLSSRPLADLPGKEGLMLLVTYPPGSEDVVHRHDAHGFIYVLEGSVVMQVRGGKRVTLGAGQTFYEGPNDVHVVGFNASRVLPAKFVVFLVKNQGAPFFVPTP
jgi:quercetin dioxygenase-like cupin family protein